MACKKLEKSSAAATEGWDELQGEVREAFDTLLTGVDKAIFVYLRKYVPTEPWIEGKWRPRNVDLVK